MTIGARSRPVLPKLVAVLALLFGLSSCTSIKRTGLQPLDRGTVYIKVGETIGGKPTDLNIAELLIGRAMLRHGFHLVASREQARYLIIGQLSCTYYKDLKFKYGGQEQHLEHQYKAEFHLTVADTQSPGETGEKGKQKIAHLNIPSLINGRLDDKLARRDIRRRAATVMAERITGETFLARKKIRDLIEELGNNLDKKTTFNDVIAKLVAAGNEAVPYLLETMADDRPVRLSGEYHGLKEWDKDSLRFYHIADKALGEIFGRYSGLGIDSTEEMVKNVTVGWIWAWEDVQKIPAQFRIHTEERKHSVKATRSDEVR